MEPQADLLESAARWIQDCDGILIAAGAGMGADSGLPTFRGEEGFWETYPALGRAQIDFQEIATPRSFANTPRLAWGFYGHRLNLYRKTEPHLGFNILKTWASKKLHGAFIYTSNVDGQFQKAGFPEKTIYEVHGSIHFLQCMDGLCNSDIWSANTLQPVVDEVMCRMTSALPRCPLCGSVARPNILMFDDMAWSPERAEIQRVRRDAWLHEVRQPVVIEIGAGKAMPKLRYFSRSLGVKVIRINPDAPSGLTASSVDLPMGALSALVAIDKVVNV